MYRCPITVYSFTVCATVHTHHCECHFQFGDNSKYLPVGLLHCNESYMYVFVLEMLQILLRNLCKKKTR